MKLGTAREADGTLVPVLVHGEDLLPLRTDQGADLAALIADPDALATATENRGAPLAGAKLAAPLQPPKIVCIGLNYLDHIREADAPLPEVPLIFAKFPSAVIGPGDPISIDRSLTHRVDWEVELAAVVGTRLSRVSAADAVDGLFGYTVANDVSARDMQLSDGQWVRAKSLDGFCPLGPVIATADEIPDPQRVAVRTTVNGETMQDSSTSEMVFGVAELIEFCSRSFVLEPGDVILTGTPWGCGEFMDPQRSLAPGDEVAVSAEGIGELRNPVIASP